MQQKNPTFIQQVKLAFDYLPTNMLIFIWYGIWYLMDKQFLDQSLWSIGDMPFYNWIYFMLVWPLFLGYELRKKHNWSEFYLSAGILIIYFIIFATAESFHTYTFLVACLGAQLIDVAWNLLRLIKVELGKLFKHTPSNPAGE